jgi:hypothetical protein
MRAQLLARDFGRIGVDQDEGEHGRSRPVVDPGMHRAALHDDVAGLHVQDLAAVELEVAFTGKQQRIIDCLGAVHEFGRAGREFGDADHRALPRADVIVALDETCALRRLGLVEVLSTGILSVDQISQPAMCGRPSRLTAWSRSSVLTTALPVASCPVTIRLTSSAMVFLRSCICRGVARR